MPDIKFVELRGSKFAIENPTDVHIQTIGTYTNAIPGDRRKQKDLAHAIKSILPSLPDNIVSVREFELGDGRNEVTVHFNLNSYELLEIANITATEYVKNVIADLRRAKGKDKEEEVAIRNEIARLEKILKKDLGDSPNPILLVMSGGEYVQPNLLPQLAKPGEQKTDKPGEQKTDKPGEQKETLQEPQNGQGGQPIQNNNTGNSKPQASPQRRDRAAKQPSGKRR